jgi:predicted nucleic acid-binding protein
MEGPQVQILHPGPRHLQILQSFAQNRLLSSALVTDSHLAALAIETQSELHSNDADFARFPGLRWHNPLA